MTSGSFNKDFVSACNDANISSLDTELIYKDVSDLVNLDTIISYYICIPPLPGYPETRLDIFLLTKDFIYNYEIKGSGDIWTVIPLTAISHFRESVWIYDDFWALIISTYRASDSDVLVILDKLDNKRELRKFAISLRDSLSGIAN